MISLGYGLKLLNCVTRGGDCMALIVINDLAASLSICRRSLYRVIRRLGLEILYIENEGKKRLSALDVNGETMNHLKQAISNPRFKPLTALDNDYRGNVLTDLKITYVNKDTNKKGVVHFRDVESIVNIVQGDKLDYYKTREYLITLADGSQVKLRSKYDLT